MKILHLSREYPPYTYGGAGVHVEHLTKELTELAEVEVRCFGDQQVSSGTAQPEVWGLEDWSEALDPADPVLRKSLSPVSVNLATAAIPTNADLVHCHTWYSMLGGLWIKILYGIPLVVTTHSLEPLRPWKEEQLGRGYQLSSWIERTAIQAADAVIAVSSETRREILDCYDLDPSKVRVICNGVDTDVFCPSEAAPVLRKYGINEERPYLLFVGRITRQKGVVHLVRALSHVSQGIQTVLCAGEPDTDEIGLEMERAVRQLQESRPDVHWIREMLPIPDLVRFYSGASLFVCPSIYEPFGIINLEAMATGCPVVASRVGGIPEAVADGETGLLVQFDGLGPPSYEPKDPSRFSHDLAMTINRLLDDEVRRKQMGQAGIRRVEEKFSWKVIARETFRLYEEVLSSD
jgi:glycogen synthase